MNRTVWSLLFFAASLSPAALPVQAQTTEGARLFETHCATCHGNPKSGVKAPDELALWTVAPETIYAALDNGAHAALQGITDAEKREVAFFLGGRRVDVVRNADAALMPNKGTRNSPVGDIA